MTEVYFNFSHPSLYFKIDWNREQDEALPYVTDSDLENFISLHFENGK